MNLTIQMIWGIGRPVKTSLALEACTLGCSRFDGIPGRHEVDHLYLESVPRLRRLGVHRA